MQTELELWVGDERERQERQVLRDAVDLGDTGVSRKKGLEARYSKKFLTPHGNLFLLLLRHRNDMT